MASHEFYGKIHISHSRSTFSVKGDLSWKKRTGLVFGDRYAPAWQHQLPEEEDAGLIKFVPNRESRVGTKSRHCSWVANQKSREHRKIYVSPAVANDPWKPDDKLLFLLLNSVVQRDRWATFHLK
jgi:hypothetical protein